MADPTDVMDSRDHAIQGPGVTVYTVIALVWASVILACILRFLNHKDTPYILHRSPTLALLSILPSAIIPLWTLWRPLYGLAGMGCEVDLVAFALVGPFWIITTLGRTIRLVFLSHVHYARVSAMEINSARERRAQVNLRKHLPDPLGKTFDGKTAHSADTTDTSPSGTEKTPPSANLSGQQGWRWIEYTQASSVNTKTESSPPDGSMPWTTATMRATWWYRHHRRFSVKAVLISIAVTLVLSWGALFAVYTALGAPLRDVYLPQTECWRTWPFLPVYSFMSLAFLEVTTGLLIWKWRGHDAHGVAKELACHLVCQAILLLGILLLAFLPGLNPTARMITAYVIPIPLSIIPLIPTVLLPVMAARAQEARRQHQESREAFQETLSDPEQFQSFLRFTITDFSLGRAMFLQRINEIAAITGLVETRTAIRALYDNYVRPSAVNAIPFPDSVIAHTAKRIKASNVGKEALNEAKEETETWLYIHTYPQYVEWHRKRDVLLWLDPAATDHGLDTV